MTNFQRSETNPGAPEKSELASARFEAMMAKHRERFQSIKSSLGGSALKSALDPFSITRPEYSPEIQGILMQAITQGRPCYEFHIYIAPDSQMKGPRAFLILMVMKQLGAVLFSQPTVEDIQGEQPVGNEVIVTLESTTSLEKITEEVSLLTEVNKVKLVNLTVDNLTK